MEIWKMQRYAIAVVAVAAVLAACGSDDDNAGTAVTQGPPGTGTGTGGGAATVTAITASQDTANALVSEVNASVSGIQEASAADFLPGGIGTVGLPTGITSQGTIDCSTLGGGSGSGSGTVSYSFTVDENTSVPTASTFAYNNCSFGAAGYSYSMNGSGSLVYTNFNASNGDYTYTLTYNVTYSFSGGGYSDSGTINSTETCTSVADVENCSYRVGDNQISNVSVQSSGSVTTIAEATVAGTYLNCVYSGWTYDAATGRATSGTVTVTDGSGNSAVVTATGSGYTVVITIGSSVSTWTVSFS